MSNCFSNLLISAPNGGGLMLVHEGAVYKLDGLDTTGLMVREREVLRGIQPALVVLYRGEMRNINSTDLSFDDIHDVLVADDGYYLVGTTRNEVVRFDGNGMELERWTFPGENDAWHINSIALWNGRVVFSAFGAFQAHREYKGKTSGAGFVRDLRSGEHLVSELSQPHSLVPCGENLLIANSERMELLECDPSGARVRAASFDGYVRGIAVSERHLFVGLSRSRNIQDDCGILSATLVALDRETWEEVARLTLPANEIYDIQEVCAADLAHVLARLSGHTSSLLAKLIGERERTIADLSFDAEQLRKDRDQLKETADRLQEMARHVREQFDQLASINGGRLDELVAAVNEGKARLHSFSEHASSQAADQTRLLLEALLERDASLASVRERVDSLNELVVQAEDSRRRAEASLQERDQHIEQLARHLELQAPLTHESVEDALKHLVLAKRAHEVALADAQTELMAGSQELSVISARASEQARTIEAQASRVSELEQLVAALNSSASMRITRPLRAMRSGVQRFARGMRAFARAGRYFVKNPSSIVRYMDAGRRLGVKDLVRRTRDFIERGGPSPAPIPTRAAPVFNLKRADGQAVIILTTPHCEYIAHEMRSALSRVGIVSKIIFECPPAGYEDVPHFVICPQMFPVLPGFYVAFQMEQSVSSRWFTEDYIRRLENSFAIFDYSTTNIAYLKKVGLSLRQIYYLPIAHLPGWEAPAEEDEADYDVVFYGDANNERRQKFLAELGRHFRVRVVREVFGEELRRVLAAARVVVNIHYYPGALLETTRIWESISLGKLIVSERSSDMDHHGELEDLVDFVDVDDIDGMVERVRYWLDNEDRRIQRLQKNRADLVAMPNRFDYFFYRFLLATDNISFEEFWREAGSKYRLDSNRLCLNLPEYTDRSDDFVRDNHYEFSLFPGLRHSQGWVGCALSYKYMIMLAREHGLEQIAICEDDVEFPADFAERWQVVREALAAKFPQWDIFSGLMANLHDDARILAAPQYGGLQFAVTDRLISTVLNMYSHRVFDAIIHWDETNRDVETNTIDRYLERNTELRVITTEPYLVGHKEEQHSTIWGFQNSQYEDMIRSSSQLLREKIGSYLERTSRKPFFKLGSARSHIQ